MKTFLEFHRTYLFASKTLIQLATDRLTNNRAYQISQAKLAIAIANQKLEKLESPVSVFRTLSEYETELPNVGELREELTVLNRRLVAACRVPDIRPSKRDKRRAIEQVKDVVEGVVLNLNPESVIKWNPQLSLLEKHLLSRFPYLSEQENLVVEGVIFGMGSTWYNVKFSGEYDTLMEPIIQRVGGGIVTRNSYGVLVLNSPSVMFVDIDIEGEDMSCRSRFGGDIKSAVNLIEAFTKYSGLAFQVYKTKNGLRLLELSRTWDAREKMRRKFLTNLTPTHCLLNCAKRKVLSGRDWSLSPGACDQTPLTPSRGIWGYLDNRQKFLCKYAKSSNITIARVVPRCRKKVS